MGLDFFIHFFSPWWEGGTSFNFGFFWEWFYALGWWLGPPPPPA